MARRKQQKPAAPPVARVVAPVPTRDLRPVIYWVLDQIFAIGYVIVIQKVVPNRLPSAALQLWTIPVCMQVMAIGTAMGALYPRNPPVKGPRGMRVTIVGAVALAASVFVGAAFLWSLGILIAMYAAFALAFVFVPERRKAGRVIAIIGGSVLLLSIIVLIARVLVSAAFLAGVYGAFGQAAATFAIVAIALVIEVVALLPIVQIKYLMSRAGKRAYS